MLLGRIKDIKKYQPSQVKNTMMNNSNIANITNREIKTQYIEIAPDKK